MPTDPSDPSSPTPSTRLYQTTSDAPKGGGGGIFVVILLLLLLGGAAAYYFLVYKPGAVAAAALPSPTPVATRAAAAAAATPTPGNSDAQRMQYVKQAEEAYSAVADPKQGAFTDSFKALMASGGLSAAGLTSKEAITARRDLVAKCQAANDDYENFIKTQEQTYKAELQKTPLAADDVRNTYDDFVFKAQTGKNVQLRDLQRDSLKTGDELLAYLDKTYGSWSIKADQHLTFKPGVAAPFSELGKKYNDQIAAMSKLQGEIRAIVDPNAPAPGASPANPAAATPAVTGAAPSPSVAPVPSATP